MSGRSWQPPLDIVKVEEADEDDETGEFYPDTMGKGTEADSDVEVLKTVADLLSNGPWLSCGSEGGKKFGRKLLDLGEKLEGWKKWEPLCCYKEEELRDVREQLKESESQLEMVKRNKEVLRNTYHLEVERRIKAEREVAELKKKAGEGMVTPVMKEVGVQTAASSESNRSMLVLQESDPEKFLPVAGMEEVVASSSEEFIPEKEEPKLQNQGKVSDDGDEEEDSAEAEQADVSDTTSSLPGTSCSPRRPRRRSGRISGRNANARKEPVRLASDNDEGQIDVETLAPSRPTNKNERRIANRSSSEGQRFQCRHCNAVLSTQSTLNRHLKRVHAKEERGNFSCYVCNKRFLDKSNFTQHLKTHPWKQSYRCKTCCKNFKNRFCLRNHIQIHETNREKTFVCSICSMKFFTSNALSGHMVVHRQETPFKCPECPKQFKLSTILKKHLAVHSNQRPFECQLCEKSFKRSDALVEHFRTHTGERPYSCRICNERFAQASVLNRHIRTHQGEKGKTHQCPFCSMKFFRAYNCRVHQKRGHKSELALSVEAELQEEGKEPGDDQDDMT